jgi:hypothetical protein
MRNIQNGNRQRSGFGIPNILQAATSSNNSGTDLPMTGLMTAHPKKFNINNI